MKKMSRTTTYSECECPFCEGYINYDQVYARHWHYDVHEDNFEYHCPNCGKTIFVKVEFTPNYTFHKTAVSTLTTRGTDHAPEK